MSIAELEAFLAIYYHGTFTKAADQLGISQPAISRRLSLLESDLNTVLFERGRHGARATPAAEAFAPFAQRALGELRAGFQAVQEVRAGDRGEISLAIAGTIPNSNLMASLRAFRKEHPEVRLAITTGRSQDVSDLVASGEVEVGIRYFADHNAVLESVLIAEEAGGIYAANPTTLVDTTSPTPDALSDCPWIMFAVGEGSSGEPFALRAREILTAAGIRPQHIVQIDGLSAQKRLLTSDFGLALMQHSAVADEIVVGTVQRIDAGLNDVRFPIHLVMRRNRYRSLLRERLVARLRGTAAQ